jgi:hypothetical protein
MKKATKTTAKHSSYKVVPSKDGSTVLVTKPGEKEPVKGKFVGDQAEAEAKTFAALLQAADDAKAAEAEDDE